jgi:uncharacterized glyoxalase superfamily protein PhnB
MTANTALFLTLRLKDAPAGIAFLREGLGFELAASYAAEGDPSRIEHAQLTWPGGGGVMLGSSDDPDEIGHAQAYLVVPTDADVDRVHAQALANGATSVREPADMDYGGRGSTVADAEGNQWSLGSYRGE